MLIFKRFAETIIGKKTWQVPFPSNILSLGLNFCCFIQFKIIQKLKAKVTSINVASKLPRHDLWKKNFKENTQNRI